MRMFISNSKTVVLLSLLIFVVSAFGQEKPAANEPVLRWRDIRELGIEGKGWTETKHFYDRLPAKAETIVRPPVWRLSQNSAGLSVRFTTDSDAIYARWTLRLPTLSMSHMPATGVSGLDLYVREDGKWHWLAVGIPEKSPTNERKLVGNLKSGKREYMLYLPLYNGVESVEIGVPEKFVLEKAADIPAASKPIAVYGTSIVQGAVASRPGMAYPAILGRRLGRQMINLGFSGNGRMEPEMANLLAEIDAAVYVVDCLPNLSNEKEVEERVEPFIKILREKRPATPIILVENIVYPDAVLETFKNQRYREKNEMLRRAYQRLLAAGVKNLFYVPSDNLTGADGESTVDGVHPSDLGFMRMAEALEPFLKKALFSKAASNKRNSSGR